MTKATKTPFETKTCGRCGGCGTYSYCQRYGRTCFGCGGSGVVLSKRGAAAKAFFDALRTVPTGRLVPGDVIFDQTPSDDGSVVYSGRAKVLNVRTRPDGWIEVEVASKLGAKVLMTNGARPVLKLRGGAEHDSLLSVALAYQATLTEKGTAARVRRTGR